MKNSILKSIFFLTLLFFTSNTASAQKANQKAIIKTFLHCDHCKECETCGLKFKTEMLKIKGFLVLVIMFLLLAYHLQKNISLYFD
jgi:hypothetical protein